MTAGIQPDYFTPNGVQQLNMFDGGQPRANSAQLMKDPGRHQSGLGNMWLRIRVWVMREK